MKSFVVCATLAFLVPGLTLSASARDVVLPAGTLLQCTLNEPNFSSASAAVGDPVLCHLRGITEFGQQAFPRGSYLVGHLESAHDPGHFWGKGDLRLQFDRIGLPSGDLPLDAKVIATRGYKVNKEGDIRGKGHAKRDIVEWMIPPLWPWKVLMLPARGPRPTLKGETVMSLRLMDDIQIPQVAQRAPLYGPGWHRFNDLRDDSRLTPPATDAGPQLARRDVVPQLDSEAIPVSYANFVTKAAPGSAPQKLTPVAAQYASGVAPGVPVFVLKSGTALAIGNYTYQNDRISYSLASGGTGVISTDEVDWGTTFRVNSDRGVRVTLRGGRPVVTGM
jgi:hypothetical protein